MNPWMLFLWVVVIALCLIIAALAVAAVIGVFRSMRPAAAARRRALVEKVHVVDAHTIEHGRPRGQR